MNNVDGILCRGGRIVIPLLIHDYALKSIHASYFGIVKVYWPGFKDNDLKLPSMPGEHEEANSSASDTVVDS